jgi:outer membrane protein assembly factor BamB
MIDQMNQVRWRNNPGGTGLQPNELKLTPANVNSSSFGQAWSATVDGGVWAQPLYMNALTVNGVPHNVLFVTTDNDSVYALDADTGAQLWHVSLIPTGASAVAGTMVDDPYIPSIGILGTPAIDANTLYVVAETAEQNATYFPHRLHALDLATGAEKFGGPVLISDPNLQPAHKLQRPGLTIANGSVYVAFGSLADKAPYHGLLSAFDEGTLAQKVVWNTTPTGSDGGIWQAGGAPSVDTSGNVYVISGNGYADGVTNFGESAIKLSPTLQVLDFFSPYNAATLTASDLDLGAASVPVMPDQNGQYPHVLIFCGKSPMLYVVNRDHMGGMGTSSDNVIQELANVVGGTATKRNLGQPCFTSPSAWKQNVYFVGNGDVLKQFTLDGNTGMLSTTPVHQGAFGYGWPGSQSMISSNGDANGIIWTFDNIGKMLRADDASDVSQSLYVSPAINTGYVKWVTPMVINGHVYIGGQGTVVAFSTY